MKQYLVSEEDIVKFLEQYGDFKFTATVMARQFLKSRPQVQEIASGALQSPEFDGGYEVYNGEERHRIDTYIYEHEEELIGKKIKIYIQEEK
jgi:hypothetical protein